jgi:hypothetical protein
VIESGFTRVYSPSINNVGTVAFLQEISRFSGLTTILTGKESVEGVIASTRFYTEPQLRVSLKTLARLD